METIVNLAGWRTAEENGMVWALKIPFRVKGKGMMVWGLFPVTRGPGSM